MKSIQIENIMSLSEDEKSKYSDLCVRSTPAGFFVGTWYKSSEGWQEPGSRDTDYMSEEHAKLALSILEQLDRVIVRSLKLARDTAIANNYRNIVMILEMDPRGVGYRLEP